MQNCRRCAVRWYGYSIIQGLHPVLDIDEQIVCGHLNDIQLPAADAGIERPPFTGCHVTFKDRHLPRSVLFPGGHSNQNPALMVYEGSLATLACDGIRIAIRP